jgi:hypothetical protein
MSDDKHSIQEDRHSSVFSSPEIFSPVFTNGDVAEIRKAAKSPLYKRLLQLADERLAAAPPVQPAAK